MRSVLLRTGAVIACTIVLIIGAAFAPLGLREIDAFRIQRVEVIGALHLDPADAARTAGITATSNLFDDPTPWLDALHAHPLIIAVSVERRVPRTLVLRVEEAVPVAFARTPELRAIDAGGRVLPADPAHDDMDLPVLTMLTRVTARSRAVDAETLRALGLLSSVMRHEPALLDWISEIGVKGSAVRLILRSAADAEVLVAPDADAAALRSLLLTLNELAAPRLVQSAGSPAARNASPDLSRVKSIDVRFHDQVVVSLHRGKN